MVPWLCGGRGYASNSQWRGGGSRCSGCCSHRSRALMGEKRKRYHTCGELRGEDEVGLVVEMVVVWEESRWGAAMNIRLFKGAG